MDTKNTFFEEVYKLLKKIPDLVIITTDLAGPPFDKIRSEFPKQYMSAGIAEQNAIQVACGMAMCGKKVIVYGVDPFITGRAFDQIRNCVSLMDIPIVIAGANAGIASDCGITHSAIEQIPLMSVCAGIKSVYVSDNRMAQSMAYEIQHLTTPLFLKFDAASAQELSTEPIDLEKGFRILHSGESLAVISMGCGWKELMPSVLGAGLNPTFIDLFSYPFDNEALVDILKQHKRIVTYEEHILRGGIGSIILEALSDANIYIPVKRIGIGRMQQLPQTYASHQYRLKELGIEMEKLILMGAAK